MKIFAQEEYGLRILLRIARSTSDDKMSIPVLSEVEGIGTAYVGKLTGILKKNGFIVSTPGNIGGYKLSKPPEEILISDVLKALGGTMFGNQFCGEFTGSNKLCVNSVDCSVRSLWRIIQLSIDRVLKQITLADLVGSEKNAERILKSYLEPEPVS